MTTMELLQKTRAAWPRLSTAPAEEKDRLLRAMADALEEHIPAILQANRQDMEDAAFVHRRAVREGEKVTLSVLF